MIGAVVPSGVAVVDALLREADPVPPVHASEEVAIARAVPARRLEFTVGRRCARRALATLGLPESEIPVGAGRAPVWPDGVIGSITHSNGYCAAAVARAGSLVGLGIDAEANAPLPSGVLERCCRPEELPQHAGREEPNWPAIAFSAKEAVYKAWFPTARRWLGFLDVKISIDVAERTFAVDFLVDVPSALEGARFEGRFAHDADRVYTAVWAGFDLQPGNVGSTPSAT